MPAVGQVAVPTYTSVDQELDRFTALEEASLDECPIR